MNGDSLIGVLVAAFLAVAIFGSAFVMIVVLLAGGAS